MKEQAMGKRITLGVAGVLLFALVFIAGFGMAVQQLWNALMPSIFNLPQLGFWQAVGLLALCWILFGSWRGIGYFGMRRHSGRWAQMSAEERERFRAGVRHRCGRRDETAQGSTPAEQ
jgi:hypothetical protein